MDLMGHPCGQWAHQPLSQQKSTAESWDSQAPQVSSLLLLHHQAFTPSFHLWLIPSPIIHACSEIDWLGQAQTACSPLSET